MKKNVLVLLALVVGAIQMQSCTRDDLAPSATNDTSTNVAAISSGVWVISSFTQRTENKTSDFAGLEFTFSANGNVAVSGSVTTTGTWTRIAPAPGSSSAAKLKIDLVTTAKLNRLNETWDIGAQTATTIQLNHPEAGEDEHLAFMKK